MSSTRSLHRPSLIAPGEEQDVDGPRSLSLTAANHSIASTPYLITSLRPFVPFTACKHGEAFTTKSAWKGVISGIRALQRLRITGGVAAGPLGALKSDLVVVSAHEQGHLMVWSADTLHAIGSCTHFNNVTVQQMLVTKSYILTRVERDMNTGKAGDDDEVYVWDLSTMTLKTKLSGHDDRVSALTVLDEDENVCVTGGIDKSILVWDIAHSAKPTAKMVGHGSTVTQLLLSGHLLVSAAADGYIKTWNLTTKTCIATLEGHQGSVCFLQWYQSYKDSVREIQRRRQELEQRFRDHPPVGAAASAATQEPEEQPVGVFVAACSGGIVRAYRCDKHELVSPWQIKAHRAFITDVCWDEQLYMSSSMAEPAINFYREGRSTSIKGHTGGEAGVRNLAVDRNRKMAMGGTDAGLLCFWSYKNLMVDPEADSVTLLMSLQPHLASISNLLLERSENSQWERLVTTSNDNTIFCMDFDVNRDSKAFHGVGLKAGVVAVPWSGSIISASEQTLTVWDSDNMTRRAIAKRTFDGHTDHITALRFATQCSKLVTGAMDNTIRCWSVMRVEDEASTSDATATVGDDPRPGEEAFAAAWANDLGMPVTCISEGNSNVIAAGCRKPNSKVGSISIVDLNTGNEIVGAMPTPIFPIAISVLVPHVGSPLTDEQKAAKFSAPVVFTKPETSSPSASPERQVASTTATTMSDASSASHAAPASAVAVPRTIYVIVQLRNGEILMATVSCNGQGVNTATPLRTVVPQQLEYYPSDNEERIDIPTGYVAALDEKYDPPRVTLLYCNEPKTLRRDEIVAPTNARPDVSRSTTFSTPLLSKVECMASVDQSAIYCAAGCELGTGYLLKASGEISYKVRYDGAVIDVQAEELRAARARRCYYRLPGEVGAATPGHVPNLRFPACTTIRTTSEARSIAFGYADGMVQVFDIVHKRICRRISAHGTVVRSVFVMPMSPRIVSLSKTGSLRLDTVYGRHVKHQGATSASAVTSAFIAAS